MADQSTNLAICELNDVRDDLKIGTLADGSRDTSNDDMIRRIINGVSGAIERYTGWSFVARDIAAKKYDGTGSPVLLLKVTPVISISALVNDTVTVTADDYVFYPETGKVELIDGTVFVLGPQKVSVTFRAGYERQNMPEEIVMAARIWTVHRFKIVKEGRQGINSSSITDGPQMSYTPGTMPPEVKEILDTYRGWR